MSYTHVIDRQRPRRQAVLGALGKVRKWQLAQALLKERAASWGEDLGGEHRTTWPGERKHGK